MKASALAIALLLVVAACGGSSAAPTPLPTPAGPPGGFPGQRPLGPPDATPMTRAAAGALAGPSGDGTTATIKTAKGDIVIDLYTESSPVSAENFINLAEAGWYVGKVFHRLVPDFVIQGGSPNGDGIGGAGYSIQDEPVVGAYGRGILAMARTQDPDSQGSQFFIVLSENAAAILESYRTYDIFGIVTSGMDVVDAIAAMPNSGGDENRALQPVAMDSVTIARR